MKKKLQQYMSSHGAAFVAVTGVVLLICFSCKKNKEEEPPGALIKFDKEYLLEEDVINKIPVGLLPEDSLAMYRMIVNNWLRTKVLSEFAQSNLSDLSVIERKVEKYRNDLIINEYLSLLRENAIPVVDEDSVRTFYELHKSQLHLESPVVKGLVVKIKENYNLEEEINKALEDATNQDLSYLDDLDRLKSEEKIDFEYFGDKWYSWNYVAELIPERIENPENFNIENRLLRFKKNGYIYYLLLYDFINSGEIAPYDLALDRIKDLMIDDKMEEFEVTLLNDLMNKARNEKRLMFINYNTQN